MALLFLDCAVAYDHLVVLSHGLHGCRHDLSYLAQKLQSSGCLVLSSSGNEHLESHNGVQEGALRLANEVRTIVKENAELQKISFVGNSLGGLYSRYAIQELYEPSTGLIAGLQAVSFMVFQLASLIMNNVNLLPCCC